MNALSASAVAGDGDAACPAADPFRLAEANINPITGLSTDYLNHFNEAIMLLEMLPVMPECRLDLLEWQPLSYQEHFAVSHLKHRELTLAAYDLADPFARGQFDEVCAAMNAAVTAAQASLRPELPAGAAAAIAEQAAQRLKPLVARASAAIHGFDAGASASLQESQAAIDAILEP